MDTVKHNGEIARLVQERLEVLDGFFLSEVEPKLVLELLVHIPVLDVRDICIDHECDEVKDQVCGFAQDAECGEAERAEARIVGRACAAHRVDHLFADLDRRREWLGVPAENVPKVDYERTRVSGRMCRRSDFLGRTMEEVAVGREHEVVQVPVAHSEQVRDDAVAGCTERLQHLRRLAKQPSNAPQLRTKVSITPGSTPYVPTLPSSGKFARR